jgi:hypothetical protein
VPIRHVCLTRKELIVTVWEGSVSSEEWLTHLRELQEDPEFLSVWKHLVDMRFGATDPSFGAETIQRGVDYLNTRRSTVAGRRVAIVTGADLMKARLFQGLAESADLTSKVFTDLSAACSWLGVAPADATPSISELRELMIRRP